MELGVLLVNFHPANRIGCHHPSSEKFCVPHPEALAKTVPFSRLFKSLTLFNFFLGAHFQQKSHQEILPLAVNLIPQVFPAASALCEACKGGTMVRSCAYQIQRCHSSA
jgi:hypothetical protein